MVIKATEQRALKDTYKWKGIVLPLIHRHVLKSVDKTYRLTGFIHPSDMCKGNWCGRHDFYVITGVPTEKATSTQTFFGRENVYIEGHEIHGKYQTWLWEAGHLYGRWFCRACEHQWFAVSPSACPVCDSPRINYNEIPLERKGTLIQGHADGALHNLPDHDDVLIEIKSIGVGTLRIEAPRLHNLYQDGAPIEEIWMKINRPFPTHIRQGQLYLWLAWPRYSSIVFIYENKANQQTKEFEVHYDPAIIMPLIDMARQVTAAVETGKPPPRPEWAEDETDKTCKACEYRSRCWKLGQDHGNKDEQPVAIKRLSAAERRKAQSLRASRV